MKNLSEYRRDQAIEQDAKGNGKTRGIQTLHVVRVLKSSKLIREGWWDRLFNRRFVVELKLPMFGSKVTDTLVSIVLALLVFFDLSGAWPKMAGLSYFLFGLPFGSAKEMVLWATILVVAISPLTSARQRIGRSVRTVAAVISVLLLCVIVVEVYQTIVFLVQGESVKLSEPSQSVFSNTYGRLAGLSLLGAFFLGAVWSDYRAIRYARHPADDPSDQVS